MSEAPVDAPPPAPPGRTGRSARSGRSARDMALSLVVLLIPLAIIVAIFRLRGGEDVVVVDPGPAIAQAREAGLPVLAPADLPESWRSVSAAYRGGADGGTLRIGYLASDGGALQLIESSEAADPLLIREFGDNPRPTGTASAGGHSWNTYQVREHETAWVWPQSGRTVIVIGNAGAGDISTLAGSLR